MATTTTDRRQGVSASQAIKVPVRAATTANITLSGEQTIDGVACVANDRVLVKDQTDASENGIYDVSTGTWTRSPDFNGSYDVVPGTIVPVQSVGTANGSLLYQITNTSAITIGTTNITFASVFVQTGSALSGNVLFGDDYGTIFGTDSDFKISFDGTGLTIESGSVINWLKNDTIPVMGLGSSSGSTWDALDGAIEIGSRAAFAGWVGNTYMANNAYYDTTNGWSYKSANVATLYQQSGSAAHIFYRKGAGTIDTAINFTELARLDGDGLKFNGDTAAANALDDYEEGTWTPTLTTDGTDFTSVTYDPLTEGTYTKIGNMCYVRWKLRTDAVTVGSASGSVVIGGVPFTLAVNAPIAMYADGWGGDNPMFGVGAASDTVIYLYYRTTANGSAAGMAVSDVGTGANANFIQGTMVIKV